MTEQDIREKITKLRIENIHVSEYQMSLDLGQSKGYIQGITSGRSLPSLKMFLLICEYFDIKPSEFFEEQIPSPMQRKVRGEMMQLTDEDLSHLLYIIQKMKENGKTE